MKEVRGLNPSFAKKILYLRNKRNMSLRQMRELTGISESYINRLEKGTRLSPSYPVIEKLASALLVEPTDLLEVGGNANRGNVVSLDQLLFSCEFTVDGKNTLSPKEIELLLNLIDTVIDCNWESDSLIADIYEVTEAVDDLKQELNA
jgi:transcriptional regulator with XRE-family HTH domain